MPKRTALVLLLFFGFTAVLAAAPAEIRAVWAHPGQFGPDPAAARLKIQAALDAYVRAGIDTVILLVKTTSGYVYYPSTIAAVDPAYAGYDFLGVFLDEAGRRRVTVQPWFCVFTEGAIAGPVRAHPEWLIRSPDGELVGSVNPALPEVRAYEMSLMLEVARRYPVEWIHLDYIRFPCSPREVYFSWDPATRALFKTASGMDPADMKARDSGNMFWNVWIDWNREQVTGFVRELRRALGAIGRPIKISAAVFPSAGEARVLIGQDWGAWAKEGLIDMLCPMLYTNHAGFFEKYVREALDAAGGRMPVLPGIGIVTSHNRNTPAGMIDQMRISRRLGAAGVVFFSGGALTEEFLAALRAEPAAGRPVRD